MFAIGTANLVDLRRVLREEATMVPFFNALDMKPEQERYGMRRGFDYGRTFSRETQRARSKRWGYYRKPKRGGVSAARPYSVWTGRFLRSTYGEGPGGRKRIRPGYLTITSRLIRPVRNPWDLPVLDRKLGAAFSERLDRVFAGRKRQASHKLTARLAR